ncbi:hypothetical protein N9A28_03650 [Sulfurimonas sp.]|nr:hypothetical protein [Sulfurimonas sp.]
MAYIAGLVIVGLFFLSLHYFTELTKQQKILVTASVFSVVILAIAFNTYSSSKRENMLNVVTKFNQGKKVNCDGLEVDNNSYTLSIGTYTFIGKENTDNYGQMISASTCSD